MGFDKSLLNFYGEPQVNWLYHLLQSFCEKVFVSGVQDKVGGGFNFIPDHFDSGGPMNGILSAFRVHPSVAWLVVPVDMPHVDDAVLKFLLSHRDETKPATCFLNPDGNLIEPFPVIVEPKAYAMLLQRFNQNEDSLTGFLKTIPHAHIMAPDSTWFINVNKPEQL